MSEEMVADAGMLVLARESRGMTQTALAKRMTNVAGEPVSQGYVSKAESGRLTVSGERLARYGQALRYPADILCMSAKVDGVGIGLVHHRKKARLGAQALRQIHALLSMGRLHSRRLLATDSSHRFEHVPINDLDSPEDAARTVRRKWNMPPGPVADLVEVIENAGGLVLLQDLSTRDLDAASQWDGDEEPLFFLNAHAPGDRFRFSLAHELAHVVMHPVPGASADQEREADRFASELLMPAADIRVELTGSIDLNRLAALKQRWRVSMAALARRALTLSAISEWQYRNLMIEMSALGYRTKEPGEVPRETPQRMKNAAARLVDQRGIDHAAAVVGVIPDDLRHLLGAAPDASGVAHR
ncbi:ImmA/IrrE family metallo-endopeptidase [Actinomadura meridiana]|uniref:ImmA/IrrE family metallo-endopeptidase n=1 Tax=Actinomadura meridiana TaxID=559626 RepID=A0ABP8CRJ1_9ACTN